MVATSPCVSAMRSLSVAICSPAPALRVCQRSRSATMAVWRSLRARCSRSSVISSVRLSLALVRSSAVSFCEAASSPSSVSMPPCSCRAVSISASFSCASTSASPMRDLASATLAMRDFGLARLPLHVGQQVARLRQLALRLAPQLAQVALLGLRRAMPLGSGLGAARASSEAWRDCASWAASAPRRLRSASRLAAAMAPWAAATNPSQRHRSPSRRHQALAGHQLASAGAGRRPG